MKTNIFDALKVSALAIIISFGLSYTFAWTSPSTTPPTGNVSAPINTGGTAQIKTGNFTAMNIGATSIIVTGIATTSDIYVTAVGKYVSELFPVNLVNAQHTATQCSSLGGSVVTDGTGNKFCRLSGASCPVGWVRYNNWTTTQANSGTYCGGLFGACTTGSHAWSNMAIESKTCTGDKICSMFGYVTSVTVNATVSENGCY